jgi:hypothetical protein
MGHVQHGSELLPLGFAHALSFEKLPGGLELPLGEYLGLDADSIEQPLEIGRLDGEARQLEVRLRADQHSVRRTGHVDRQSASSVRQVHRDLFARCAKRQQHVAERGRASRAHPQRLDADENPRDARVGAGCLEQLAQSVQRYGLTAALPEGKGACDLDQRPVDS